MTPNLSDDADKFLPSREEIYKAMFNDGCVSPFEAFRMIHTGESLQEIRDKQAIDQLLGTQWTPEDDL